MRLLFQRPDLALAWAGILGAPSGRVGQGFLCTLPGHKETHPSVALRPAPKTGALQHRDWQARSGSTWNTLRDVRASLLPGGAAARTISGPMAARLPVEAGILEPDLVSAHPLPPDVRPAVRTVCGGLLH